MSKRPSDQDNDGQKKRKRSYDTPAPPLYHLFQGEVASVKEYGMFVKIPGSQRQGLVHKSQISKARVDDPSEMFAKGEMVFCKVISLDEDGDKIGLAMKMVNQTSGRDLDPNNVELSQDEKRRKQFGGRHGRQKIELDAVYNTVCRKCNGQGHLAQDCFKTGDTNYDLIPELDEYMPSVQDKLTVPTSKTSKKEKKQKKSKKKKKKHKKSDSDSSDSEERSKKKKRKHSQQSDSDSDDSKTKKKKHKKRKKQHRKHDSSSSSDG